MLVDYHIHTDHSVDAQVTIRQVCERAIELGLDEIAVTDHLDGNPSDPGFGRYDVDRWFADFEPARAEYADRLVCRAGVEVGEPHEYPDIVDLLARYPFDVILGSAHYIGTRGVHEALFDELPVDEALEAYFELEVRIASSGLIDVMSHLDCFQRYTLERGLGTYDPQQYEGSIRRVLQAVIDHDVAIEVNTSGLRQQPGVCFPDRTILSWYHEMGGRAVTVGSDAHYAEHVGANLTDAVALLRDVGFDSLCVFERRRRSTIPLPEIHT